MVSNLPYYITTPVLFHFLESPLRFKRLVVMVQEEVGLRMTAKADTPEYGVLAIVSSYYADVDIVHRVSRRCFVPRPNVDSAIVRFRCREDLPYPDIDRKFLMSLIRSAFLQRRKTLKNALVHSGSFGAAKEAVEAAFPAAGIDPNRRAQTMTLDEFARLAKEIRARI
jgi:16S rRNA (adenine1518-N6/adenine1519-N6)-dimethyltransferase